MIQSIETVKFTATDLDRFAQELNRDGICVIRGLFDQGLIEESNPQQATPKEMNERRTGKMPIPQEF